ncbi:MAG: hypothetical protein AAGI03_02080 [Pseudomonadota bacterium]
MPDWPADLPFFDVGQLTLESPQNLSIKSDMDVGPPKVRRRSTAGVEPFSGAMRLITRAQFLVFRSFYNVDLQGGVLSFTHADPFDGVIKNFRFESYEITRFGPKYRVTANLVILP